MAGRKERAREQGTFIPPQGEVLAPQPNYSDQIFEPDMRRHFYWQWSQVRMGKGQWMYHRDRAESIIRDIGIILEAAVERIGPDTFLPKLWADLGLEPLWQRYWEELEPLHRAYPAYIEWFAQRVELEYQETRDKWSSWLDSLLEEDWERDYYRDREWKSLHNRLFGLSGQLRVMGQLTGLLGLLGHLHEEIEGEVGPGDLSGSRSG